MDTAKLNDKQIENMYLYIEVNGLAKEIGLVEGQNDPVLFANNTNKAVAYLSKRNLLDTAIN